MTPVYTATLISRKSGVCSGWMSRTSLSNDDALSLYHEST